MHLIRSLDNINIDKPLCLTIGNFDGFHLGHKKIIQKLKEIAKQENLATALLTFEPHPKKIFEKKLKDFRINSVAQKIKITRDLGIDYAIIINFNQNFSKITADYFLEEVIVKKLNTKYLVVGHDFCFGKDKAGDINFLQERKDKYKFKTTTIEPVFINEILCSSSNARNFIKNAKIKDANQILGHNFSISSIVKEGKKIGRTIGFPTVNIASKNHLIKPKYGVYKTKTFIPHLNKKFDSITNFGVRPTISNQNVEFFETHIFNFHQEIYGRKIYLEFLDFIRPEKKFLLISDLKDQIKKDIDKCHLLAKI